MRARRQRIARPRPLLAGLVAGALCGAAACGSGSSGPTAEAPMPGESSGGEQAGPTGAEPTPATYDAVPLIPREVLFGNPSKIAPQLSPDGARMAYIAPHEGVLNVWVKTVGKDDDRVITADKLRGIRQYFWAENGKHLLYLQDKGGDENWHVYAVPLAGGDAVDLTPLDGVLAQVVAVERKHPNHLLVGLNDRNPQLHDVHKIDLRSGKRTLVYKNDINAIGFVADHKLRVRIAQVLTPDGGAALMHRPHDKAPWKKLLTWGPEDTFTSSAVAFAGDDRTLYILSSQGSNTTELRALDTRTGKQETIASDPTADVTNLYQDPVTHRIQAVGFTRARVEWKVIDPALKDQFGALAGLGEGDYSIISADAKNRTWLVAFDDDDHPGRYYTFDRKAKKGELLFSARPELDDYKLAEMKPVTYQARDGLPIQGYLTLPPGVEPRGLPTVIHPHGGPWARDMFGFDPTSQWLANRGYAVLQPNFRGSTGYGKKFLNAADRQWGGAMQDDITDGTRWLVEQGIADPKRICIMGGSYGGYATLMGLVREPELYACGVNIVGVANLITWMKTIPPYWVPFRHILVQRVGDPDKDAEFLKSRSPVFLVDRIRAPLLIAQGANDPRVPRDESIQIRDAMTKAGKKVEFVEYADEGHGFARPQNRLDFFGRAEVFLARHLGGRAEQARPAPAAAAPAPAR